MERTSSGFCKPDFQAVFTRLGKGFFFHSFLLNMYTAPAFLMVFVSISAIIILLFFFKEDYAGVITQEKNKGKAASPTKSKVIFFQIKSHTEAIFRREFKSRQLSWFCVFPLTAPKYKDKTFFFQNQFLKVRKYK